MFNRIFHISRVRDNASNGILRKGLNRMKSINEIYGICCNWKLRIKYYPRFGSYIEAYSELRKCWVVTKRISYLQAKD